MPDGGVGYVWDSSPEFPTPGSHPLRAIVQTDKATKICVTLNGLGPSLFVVQKCTNWSFKPRTSPLWAFPATTPEQVGREHFDVCIVSECAKQQHTTFVSSNDSY